MGSNECYLSLPSLPGLSLFNENKLLNETNYLCVYNSIIDLNLSNNPGSFSNMNVMFA